MNDKNGILVSVVVPTYNRPDYLERLLLSLNGNEEYIYEVIIVDDNSTNSSEYTKVIEKFSKKYNIVYIRNSENKGAPYCRNIGIDIAKMEYLALTDDDDEWLPGKLRLQMEKMKANIGLVYTWAKAVDDDRREIYVYNSNYSGKILYKLLEENFIPSSSVLVRKEAILKAGKFDEAMPSCQDWDMWIRIADSHFDIDVVDEVKLLYYKHSGLTIGKSKKAKQGYFLFYKKHFWLYIKSFLVNSGFRSYVFSGLRRRVCGKFKLFN